MPVTKDSKQEMNTPTLDSIKAKLGILAEEISKLKSENESLKAENEDLNHELTEIKKNNLTLQTETLFNSNTDSKDAELKEQLTEIINEIDERIAQLKR